MWFREYVFNVLIQPFHLILYTILVGAAISLATESLVYAVVAIYFLNPAEKLLRKFFGFDNAGTLSAAGSFAGGAVFSSIINKLNRPKPPEKEDDKEKEKKRKPTVKDRNVSANAVMNSYADGTPSNNAQSTAVQGSSRQGIDSFNFSMSNLGGGVPESRN